MRPDRVTSKDKELEKGMVEALGKENFYGKKPKAVIVKKEVVKVKPLSAKEREAGMINELGKEDFYGEKKAADFMKKKISDVIKDAQSEKIIEEMKKRGFGKAGRLGAAKKS